MIFMEEGQEVEDVDQNYYPNCDFSIWLRSCDQEVIEPIEGKVLGLIPSWVNGSLLRNGPGSIKAENETFKHLFDSSALLHRFHIADGKVTYQNRFVNTETLKKNRAAKRIVLAEFGTAGVPDPCQTIFQRISTLFTPGEGISDNSLITVYPFGDDYYTFNETPVIHRIDPTTLETKERVNLSKYLGIVNHSSHPHVLPDKRVFSLGMGVGLKGPYHCIVEFDCTKQDYLESARIVGRAPARWPLNPSYMHTFGLTDNFFILVEQPFTVNIIKTVTNYLNSKALYSGLNWYPNEKTLICLISRKNGSVVHTFRVKSLFFLHIINCYESLDGKTCVVDLCAYKDPKMIDCMFIDAMKQARYNIEYAQFFRARPIRLNLPLTAKINSEIEPELLYDLGCETPRIHYEQFLGKPYRFFYAISSDVDGENPGTLIKIDLLKKKAKTWNEKNLYPSEPIFVPNPNAQNEDDGVVLSALVWSNVSTRVGVLVLDAKSWKEKARVVFETPHPVPKCLHGWFAPQTNATEILKR